MDKWLCRCHRCRLQRLSAGDGVLVDVGIGEFPWTTLDLLERLEGFAPELEIVGTELDPRRVRNARRLANARFRVLERGFDLGLPAESVGVIRMMNVLREYHPDRSADHCAALWPFACDDALLVEGSSDKHGSIFGAHVMTRSPAHGVWHRRGLLFGTDFERGFAPIMFRDWLPQDLRRTVLPGTELHDVFDAWTHQWEQVRGETHSLQLQFARSVSRLGAERTDVSSDPWLRENGYLLWQPAGGVPDRASCLKMERHNT